MAILVSILKNPSEMYVITGHDFKVERVVPTRYWFPAAYLSEITSSSNDGSISWDKT